VIICDDAGYPFLEICDAVLSALFRNFDRGRAVRLVLPNPDVIYPKGAGEFGFTAGAIALLLEAALERRYPGRNLHFVRLGKPGPAMFERAQRLAPGRLVMIGDQLETDIAGALAAGIDAALLAAGVTRWDDATPAAIAPTYLLDTIMPGPATG
jgi:ribonucleotide monophosphatase NagD (HAD superfamily)